MSDPYFNYRARLASDWWERRAFVLHWWRISAADPRWVPPDYRLLRRELEPRHNPQLMRLRPLYFDLEALPRPRQPMLHRQGSAGEGVWVAPFAEVPVGTALGLRDPRREDGKAYFALLSCANDPSSLERLLDGLAKYLRELGCQHMVGPVGITPYLGSGVLYDDWMQQPPQGAASNPPYLPDLLGEQMNLAAEGAVYELSLPLPAAPDPPSAGLEISPLEDTAQLSEALLPLLRVGLDDWGMWAPVDGVEAEFWLRWTGRQPRLGWLAVTGGRPVGFVLMQGDHSSVYQRTGGGRRVWLRPLLGWLRQQPSRRGQILAGGVLPEYRGKGIGRVLLGQAASAAVEQGWQTLSCGPLLDHSHGARFLLQAGAIRRLPYRIYQRAL